MLYPDFNDLIAFKALKKSMAHPFSKTVKSTAPGNHHSPFRGQGLEFDAVRPYVAGDDIRSIDWRVTARTGSAHVKLFKEERERFITICVDMNATMRFGTKKTFKSVQAARIASLLGWQSLAKHDRISACLFGDIENGIHYFAPGRTQRSFYEFLKALTLKPKEQEFVPLKSAIAHIEKAVATGSLIYFISDFMHIQDDIQHGTALQRLCKRCDVIFIAVNDPADMALPPMGFLSFRGYGKSFFANTKSKKGAIAYNIQWQENRKLLQEITTRLKIPTIELTTESDVRKDIILGLKSIAKR